MNPPLSRRTALKAAGSLGIGIATGTIFAPSAAARDHAFAAELETVRASTRPYRDVRTARDNGYEFFAVVPFVGVVFENLEENVGNVGHAEDPSLLFYAPTAGAEIEDGDDVANTNTVLAGIEYHVEGDHGDDQDIFADEAASRELKVTEAEGWHANPQGRPITGLHVWIHLENPNGVFATEHPTIRDRLSD